MKEPAEHEWVKESIAGYLMGGLTPEERGRVEAHMVGCAPCRQQFEQERAADETLRNAFATQGPAPGFEDRLIQSLRAAPPPRRLSLSRLPLWLRAGAAAAILVAGMGAAGYIAEMSLQPRYRAEEFAQVSPQPEVLARRDQPKWASRSKELDLEKRVEDPVMHNAPPTTEAETPSDEDYRKAKGETMEEVSDKPFKGKDTYDAIGGGGGAAGKHGGPVGGRYVYRDLAPAPQVSGARAHLPHEVLASLKADGISQDAQTEKEREAERKSEPAQDPAQRQGSGGDAKPPAPEAGRKIIRSGTIEFEIESFDSTVMQIAKIAAEEGGFVATINSERLANGKVRGSVVVRVPPERLDTLVLKLRALGDLKSQQISSQDVTKHYTDMESQLRAARAMEERLLQIIREGKGAIKELLAAEKELGVWREKIEVLEGEIRYCNNLISLSTLTIHLIEKDIRRAAAATEREQVDMAVETEDVKKAYDDAQSAVRDAKGRILKADLKSFDAGQMQAVILCEAPPDQAGILRDRLSQLGKVVRLDVNRETNLEGGIKPVEGLSTKREDTRITLSIYNLANIAPRETVEIVLACENVEQTFQATVSRVRKMDRARIVASQLSTQKGASQASTLHFEVPSAEAETIQRELRGSGEVMREYTVENPDTLNVTTAKRGFRVTLWPLRAVAPRETVTILFAAKDVPAAYRGIQQQIRAGRVVQATLNEKNPEEVTGWLTLELPREEYAKFDGLLQPHGLVLSSDVQRKPEGADVVDSKVLVQMTLTPAATLAPREVHNLSIEVQDVNAALSEITRVVGEMAGKVQQAAVTKARDGSMRAEVQIRAPLRGSSVLQGKLAGLGLVRMQESTPNTKIPENDLAAAVFQVTLQTPSVLVAQDEGLGSQLRAGLATGLTTGIAILRWIVTGSFIFVPLFGVAWLIFRLVRRRPAAAPTA